MAYKSILTFLALEESNEALNNAIELAQASDAHLDIVVLGTLRSPPFAMHDAVPAVEWVRHNREVMDRAFARVKEIEQYVAEESISAAVVAECDYPMQLQKVAARYALCTDVHIMTKETMKANESIQRAFSGTLFDANCPVLLMPTVKKDLDEMSKVAIAWNGRAEAAHAVRSAMPFLKRADRVHIIVVDPVKDYVGDDPGSDLAAYLSRHDIDITVDILASGGMTVSEKLMQRTTDIDADLLIMGGYGHSKLWEWFLGGATRDMLEAANLPVLMVH
ncbi:MAG: universal stress protein [Rhizobiaceae bacterium]|nr:universal stress protein [Rhizobiaceae bacterium]